MGVSGAPGPGRSVTASAADPPRARVTPAGPAEKWRHTTVGDRRSCRLPPLPHDRHRALPTRHASLPPPAPSPPEKWRRTTGRGPPQVSSPATSAAPGSTTCCACPHDRSPRALPTRHAGPPRVPGRPAREVAANDRSRTAAGVVSRHFRRARPPPAARAHTIDHREPADPPRGPPRVPGRPAREVAANDQSRTAAGVVSRHFRTIQRERCRPPPPRVPGRPAREVAANDRRRLPPLAAAPGSTACCACPTIDHRERCRPATRGRLASPPTRPRSGGERPVEDRRSCRLPPLPVPTTGPPHGRVGGRVSRSIPGPIPGRSPRPHSAGTVTAPGTPGRRGPVTAPPARLGPPRAGRARRDDDAWRVRDGPARSRPRRGVRRVAPGRRHDCRSPAPGCEGRPRSQPTASR